MSNKKSIEDLLSELTDAVNKGEDTDHISAGHTASDAEVYPYIHIVKRLNTSLSPVEPSSDFQQKLYNDLMMHHEAKLVERVKELPTRVRIVASVMAVLGFALITRRRIRRLMSADMEEDVERGIEAY